MVRWGVVKHAEFLCRVSVLLPLLKKLGLCGCDLCGEMCVVQRCISLIFESGYNDVSLTMTNDHDWMQSFILHEGVIQVHMLGVNWDGICVRASSWTDDAKWSLRSLSIIDCDVIAGLLRSFAHGDICSTRLCRTAICMSCHPYHFIHLSLSPQLLVWCMCFLYKVEESPSLFNCGRITQGYSLTAFAKDPTLG